MNMWMPEAEWAGDVKLPFEFQLGKVDVHTS
jgi:hypothetical protein